jgi:DNA-binding transcriptional ArsR family regulator
MSARGAASETALIEQFKAIAHPLRMRILDALSGAERNVGELEQATGIGQPALSQQLGVLRKAGLVETRKEAKLVFYRLAAGELKELSAVLAAMAKPHSAPRSKPATAPLAAPGVANFARLS